jgi:carbamoyltransferase
VVDGLFVTGDPVFAHEMILQCLRHVGYVNLVRGAMEFGPRAMCNTSTLAMPRPDVVTKINEANNRNTVMPMAPVMTRSMYEKLFLRTDRLWKSEMHMITAMEFAHVPTEMMGIGHLYARPYKHCTGRPQVTRADDSFLNGLLNAVGHPLINTSFNYHGKPIAFDVPSIIDNHQMQRRRDNNFFTIVLK